MKNDAESDLVPDIYCRKYSYMNILNSRIVTCTRNLGFSSLVEDYQLARRSYNRVKVYNDPAETGTSRCTGTGRLAGAAPDQTANCQRWL